MAAKIVSMSDVMGASLAMTGERSPVEITAGLLRGRWTTLVIWHLFWGEKRFYQLLRETDGISRRALAHELEELERLEIVERRVRHLGPAKVQYALTDLGESLKLVVGAMYEWGLHVRHRQPAGGFVPRPPSPVAPSDSQASARSSL